MYFLPWIENFCQREKASPRLELEETYQLRILKKWRQRLCLGSGARPERAGSIG